MAILVKEVMSKPAITIDVDATARDAGALMRRTRRGFVIITTKEGLPVGVISDSDLIKHVVEKDQAASQVRLRDIMSRRIVSIGPNENVLEAVRKMKRNNIKQLPVIEGKKVLGVISLADVARTSPEMIDLLEYRLRMKERPPEIKEEFTAGICDRCLNYYARLRKVDDEWVCESCTELVE
jgi:CBS domain-containing protein